MSSCNSSSGTSAGSCSGFPNASTMDQMATNYALIATEEAMIQQAILAASSQCQTGGGQFCTTVGGTTPMTFVSGAGSVTVVNGGSGYFQDTPSVHFIPPIGVTPSVIATGTVVTNGGNILAINIVNGGIGYQPVPATVSVSSLSGIGANLQLLVDGAGGAAQVNIISGGSGYTVNDTVVATRAVAPNVAYVDAVFKVTSVSLTGELVEIVILNPGSGYQPSVTTAQIVSTLNPSLPYPLGTGFMSDIATDINGTITQIVVTNTGAGYAVYSPYLVITDPGTGAQTKVTLGTGLTATSVASIAVTAPGTGYDQLATGTVLNPPTGSAATTPAVVTINVPNNTYGTNPNLYWQVWSGTATNTAIAKQLNAVLSYFTCLGYTISIISNPATGSTIMWKICW
jgi:hypothetical protein